MSGELIEARRVLEFRVHKDDHQGVKGHPERVADEQAPPQSEIKQGDVSRVGRGRQVSTGSVVAHYLFGNSVTGYVLLDNCSRNCAYYRNDEYGGEERQVGGSSPDSIGKT